MSDPIKDRVPVDSTVKNEWLRQGTDLVYKSDGKAGKIAPPVAFSCQDYEMEVLAERLEGGDRLHLDLPMGQGRILPLIFNDTSRKVIHEREGRTWPQSGKTVHVDIRFKAGSGGGADRMVIRRMDTGETLADWAGNADSLAKKGEDHLGFPGRPVASVFTMKSPYAIKKWTLKVYEGTAEVLRSQSASSPGTVAAAAPAPGSAPDTFGGHRYQYVEQNLTWQQARDMAVSAGGHLAVPGSKEEDEWLISRYASGMRRGGRIWLGGWTDQRGDPWRWVTGEPFAYNRWGPREPDYGPPNGGQPAQPPFTVSYYNVGTSAPVIEWHDAPSHAQQSLGYIVEWDDAGSPPPAAATTPAVVLATAPQRAPGVAPNATDLLAGLMLARDIIAGPWSRENGELAASGNSNFNRVAFEVAVPEEYDFRIQFTRKSGTRAVSMHVVLPGGMDVMLLLDGFETDVFGWETVDGKLGNQNPTTQQLTLENGRRYEAVVKVRRGRLMVDMDGRPFSDFKIGQSKLAVADVWRYPNPRKLGIGCQQPTVFHSAELIPFTGVESQGLAAIPDVAAKVPGDARLAQLESGFKARYTADAQKPYEAAMAALNQGYLRALAGARATAQRGGVLEDVTALDRESQRIQDNEEVPAMNLGGTPDVLAGLRATYRATQARHLAAREAKAAPLYDLYLGALDGYIAELTRSNQIDKASAVEDLRENVARQKPDPSLTSAAPASKPVSGPKGAAPSPVDLASSASSWREVTTWALSIGGKVRVRAVKDNRETDLTDIENLPASKFDVVELDFQAPASHKWKDEDFTRVALAKDLRAITLSGLPVATLSPLRGLKNLQRFTMYRCRQITASEFRHLAESPMLKDITLDEIKFDDTSATALTSLSALESLSITHYEITDAGMKDIARMKSLKLLRLLYQEGKASVSDAGVQALTTLPQLESLYLASHAVTGESLPTLARMGKIRRLRLAGCDLTLKGIQAIGQFSGLDELALDGVQTVNDTALAGLGSLTKLRVLDLNSTKITGTGFASMAACKNLKSISLRAASITGAGLAVLARTFPALEGLRMDGGLQEGAVKSEDFAPLAGLRSLNSLGVGFKGLDDAMVAECANISSLKFLSIGLDGVATSKVTAAGLKPLQDLKNLQELALRDIRSLDDSAVPVLKGFSKNVTRMFITNTGISDTGRKALKDFFPGTSF